jgi:dTDP-4-dehydrorhamnose reductase
VSDKQDFVARLRRYDQVGPKTIITEAAAEIERLTAERDDARREILMWVKERCSWAELTQEIEQRGWKYLKEKR